MQIIIGTRDSLLSLWFNLKRVNVQLIPSFQAEFLPAVQTHHTILWSDLWLLEFVQKLPQGYRICYSLAAGLDPTDVSVEGAYAKSSSCCSLSSSPQAQKPSLKGPGILVEKLPWNTVVAGVEEELCKIISLYLYKWEGCWRRGRETPS